VHKVAGNRVRLFWRKLFFRPNEVEVSSWVPRNHPAYEGIITDPSVRMTLGHLVDGEGTNCDLWDQTPLNTLYGVIKMSSPPYKYDKELEPVLHLLAKAAGVKALFAYTVTRPNVEPFRSGVERIF
jgi:hypothetical protein